MFASNRTAPSSKIFCAMSCTTFVAWILSGTGSPLHAAHFSSFIRRPGMRCGEWQFERELACDLAAVSDSPKGRAKYAECLIHFARLNSSQDSSNWGIDFAASSTHLKARVHSILAETKKPSAWLVGSRIACGLALLAGFLAIEPSLGVLLTYAQQQIAQPLTAEIHTGGPRIGTGTKASKRGRLSKAPATADGAVASVSQANDPMDFAGRGPDGGSAAAQSSMGPQLFIGARQRTEAAQNNK